MFGTYRSLHCILAAQKKGLYCIDAFPHPLASWYFNDFWIWILVLTIPCLACQHDSWSWFSIYAVTNTEFKFFSQTETVMCIRVSLKLIKYYWQQMTSELMLLCFQLDSESIVAGKAAIGNLLGGIGYFFGQSKIAISGNMNVSCWLLRWATCPSFNTFIFPLFSNFVF